MTQPDLAPLPALERAVRQRIPHLTPEDTTTLCLDVLLTLAGPEFSSVEELIEAVRHVAADGEHAGQDARNRERQATRALTEELAQLRLENAALRAGHPDVNAALTGVPLRQAAQNVQAAAEQADAGVTYLRAHATPDWHDVMHYFKTIRQCLADTPDVLNTHAAQDAGRGP